MKKEAQLWIDLAKEDFKDMTYMWKAKRYRGAVLFAQQAVEKIIKGYIVEKKSKAPRRIHAIEELVKDAGLDLKETDSLPVEELSKSYTRVRYTDLSVQYYPTKESVEPLLKMAQKIYLWVQTKLQEK